MANGRLNVKSQYKGSNLISTGNNAHFTNEYNYLENHYEA